MSLPTALLQRREGEPVRGPPPAKSWMFARDVIEQARHLGENTTGWRYGREMAPNAHTATADRVVERRRAVALARHYREADGLSIAQIADRLGRSPATVKAYFYDPTGEKARAVKTRYQGVAAAAARTRSPATARATPTPTARPAILARSSGAGRPRVLAAMHVWRARYGRLPSSYDWSRTHAERRGGVALLRLSDGDWPSPSVVTEIFGNWAAARASSEQTYSR